MVAMFDKNKHKIYVIAPASSTATYAEREATLTTIRQYFDDRELQYIMDDDIFAEDCLPFYANNLANRTRFMQQALLDPDVKIIWALRGGYGSAELFPSLEAIPAQQVQDKILIGFSDITALHGWFNNYWQLPSIHGEVLSRIVKWQQPDLINDLLALANGDVKEQDFSLTPMNKGASKINGKILGGNLTVLNSLIATKAQPQEDGFILLLEDVDERGYAVMRNLTQLAHTGMLQQISAIIFADFIGGDEKNGKNYVADAITEFVAHYCQDTACLKLPDIGHGDVNKPIILAANAVIQDNKLTIKNPFGL